MGHINMHRRSFLTYTGGLLAGLAAFDVPFALAFPLRDGEEVLPWADPRPENPAPDVVKDQLDWEAFDSWLTPNDRFFSVAHYGWPEIDAADWSLKIEGLVREPTALRLKDIEARPRQEVVFTLECSGNHGFPWFTGGIGTARWGGTPLAAVLEQAGPLDAATEVVFFGHDSGEREVREITYPDQFARSMSLEDAMSPNNLLCYDMNGADLPALHGHPLRLIAPGWYGIANVKWLERIELRSHRWEGHFMATDYVTVREMPTADGGTEWTRTSVGPSRIKSVPARVTRLDGQTRVTGAAWGKPIDRVEVRIDGGDWQPATIDTIDEAEFAWKIWTLDWPDPAPGEHTVTSRAIGLDGEVQPAMDDPIIADKKTYWESNGQVTRSIVLG
jgi:DMSO/TMAO reductase YedYZ molybdopterin-dependent catalytic subunit